MTSPAQDQTWAGHCQHYRWLNERRIDMFSNTTWSNLAREYNYALRAWKPDLVAADNAFDLAQHVRSRTIQDDRTGYCTVDNLGVWWEPVEDDTPYVDFDAMRTAYAEALETPLRLQRCTGRRSPSLRVRPVRPV